MVAWSKDPNEDPTKKISITDYKNFMSIKTNSGSGSQAILNSYKLFSFMTESCYNFDKVVNIHGHRPEVMAVLIRDLETMYNNKDKTEAGAAVCETCLLEQVNKTINSQANIDLIKEALKDKSFGEFLYTLTIGNCEFIEFEPKPEVGYFPQNKEEGKREKLLPKIKEVLATDNPVNIDGVCVLRDEATGVCKGKHSFVISGYKELCPDNKKECSPEERRYLVKVHNSWGEDWQKDHNDGWVDAMPIIENINDDKSTIGIATISWLK